MHNRLIGPFVLAALGAAVITHLVAVPAALAHDGHIHTVMGTVTAIDQKHVEIKTPSGEILSIALNEKTTFVRAKRKIDPAELTVGKRVVIGIGNGEDPLIAGEIQIAAASAAPAHAASAPAAPAHKDTHK